MKTAKSKTKPKAKQKPKKRKKLESLARIRRRLMRLWTAKVAEEWGHKCAVCGSTNIPNAHHLENRNTCRALRYDPMNGVLLCPSHHKFGKDSAHKGGLWFADWLLKHHPDRFAYVMKHRDDDVNLNNREYLAEVEAKLREPPVITVMLTLDAPITNVNVEYKEEQNESNTAD